MRSIAALWSRTTVWPLAPERWTSAMNLRWAAKSAFASPVSGGSSRSRASYSYGAAAGRLVLVGVRDEHAAPSIASGPRARRSARGRDALAGPRERHDRPRDPAATSSW